MVWLAPLREPDHYVVFKINLWFMPLLSNSVLLVPVCLSTLYWRKLGVSNRLIATISLAGKFLFGIYYFIIIFLSYWFSFETINFIRIFPTPNLLLQEASSEQLLSTLQHFHSSQQNNIHNWNSLEVRSAKPQHNQVNQSTTIRDSRNHVKAPNFNNIFNERNTYSESFRTLQHRGWVKDLICETSQRQSNSKG